MKRLLLIITLLSLGGIRAQEEAPQKTYSFDANYFYGSIANHNSDILHLITGHPSGVIFSYNKKTFGDQSWQQRFNYPDLGYSLIYQNLKNEYLGKNIGVYAHYNFYFLKRNIMLRVGQGIAHTTKPYNSESNPRNIAFGTRLLSSTYLMLNYKKEKVFKTPFGFQAGLSLIHYSNANVKAPNTSINSITANIGLTYTVGDNNKEFVKTEIDKKSYRQPLHLNIMFRGGVNQSDVIGTKQFPFYIPAVSLEKRIGQLSALHFGAELFISKFLEEDIKFNVAAFPENNVDPDTDYKRLGVFIGHELFINKLSVLTQVGFYAYYPYEFEKRVYLRVGLKKYFGKRYFGIVSLKSHGAAAEAVELGVGMKLNLKRKQ